MNYWRQTAIFNSPPSSDWNADFEHNEAYLVFRCLNMDMSVSLGLELNYFIWGNVAHWISHSEGILKHVWPTNRLGNNVRIIVLTSCGSIFHFPAAFNGTKTYVNIDVTYQQTQLCTLVTILMYNNPQLLWNLKLNSPAKQWRRLYWCIYTKQNVLFKVIIVSICQDIHDKWATYM